MPELLCGEATGVRINLLLNNIWPLGETHAEARGGGGGLFFTSDYTTLVGRTLKRTKKKSILKCVHDYLIILMRVS